MSHRRPILLAVFAHPDDETFLAGGTLAVHAGRGWDVRLVCATRGEAGRRGPYAALSGPEFAAVRAAELGAACRALGIPPPRFLDVPDGGVTEAAPAILAAVTECLRDLEPRVVITFGPDGISGHADHVALHRVVTTAFTNWRHIVQSASRAGQARADARLYYVLRTGAVPACCRPRGTAPPPLTTVIDIAGAGEWKLAAIRCHRSQEHLHPMSDDEVRAVLTSPEHFHRAWPAWERSGAAMESALWGARAHIPEDTGHVRT